MQGVQNFLHKPLRDMKSLYSTTSLVVRLQGALAQTLDAWKRYDTPRGDISNLCNLSLDTKQCLDDIRKLFNLLGNLHGILSELGERLTILIQFYSFSLAQTDIKEAEQGRRATQAMILVCLQSFPYITVSLTPPRLSLRW
jgi:hypothetical protein